MYYLQTADNTLLRGIFSKADVKSITPKQEVSSKKELYGLSFLELHILCEVFTSSTLTQIVKYGDNKAYIHRFTNTNNTKTVHV